MTDLMVDIETLSTDSNAMVLSISAVQFDLKTGTIGKTFEAGLEADQNECDIDVETILWWMAQSEDAREQITNLERQPVLQVLADFNVFCEECNVKRLWGNGATFDNVIIRNLYKRMDREFVVPFWCDSDVRTLVSVLEIERNEYEFVGTPHNGLDDCKHQIKYLCGGYKKWLNSDLKQPEAKKQGVKNEK